MEEQIKGLVDKIWGHYEKSDISTRVLIALAGLPASGKTTIASALVQRLNHRYHTELGSRHPEFPEVAPYVADMAFFVPLDGYHLTRAQLAAMPDPEEAAYRRGAAFTFDGQAYYDLVQQLRGRILPETRTIYCPSFDHATKDPVQNDIPLPPSARVVVFEGLYVALDEEVWRDAAGLMDELWFIEVPMEVAVERLVKRHVAAGLSPNEEHARTRAWANDMRNGQQILDHRLPVHGIIQSVEDDAWEPKEPETLDGSGEPTRPEPERLGSIAGIAIDGGGC